MVPRVFSTLGDWLLSLLRRYDKNGHLPNVLLCRDRGEPTAGFEEGESPVALVRTGDGRELTLIGERLIERGHTLIRFGEVVRCRWITDQNDALDKARLKQTHFDRLILELESGQKVVLEELGPAVFPLIRFFQPIISAVGPNAPMRPSRRKKHQW